VSDSELDRLKGHLHDVSNVLSVVLGWAEEAKRSLADGVYVEHALGVIEVEARRARSLARRAIGAASEPVPRDVRGVLKDLVAVLSQEAKRKHVTLSFDGFESALIGDSDALYHVVSNLVHNAFSYAPVGSVILLSADVDEQSVLITVADDGPGVPEARRTSIFAGDSTREGGAGVGLAHSRATSRLAGGELWLAPSTNGARFCVEWPLHRIPAAPRSSVAAPAALHALRVLIVEDDAGVSALLEGALDARGADVAVAATLAQALAARGPFDALLLDLSPLGDDLNAAAVALRAAHPGAQLVVTTGSVDLVPTELEFAVLVRKPFEVSEVVQAIVNASAGKP
jgi:CheY-like chemotaxis protein